MFLFDAEDGPPGEDRPEPGVEGGVMSSIERCETRNPGRTQRWIVPLSLAFALGASGARAADPCSSKTYELNVPDAATLKLKDGVHTIAAVKMETGKLEVRVRVKGIEISENEFWANGKLLKEMPESSIPKDLRRCLTPAKASLAPGTLVEEAARVLSGWLEREAEARNTRCVYKVTATCYQYAAGKYWCAYHVCCGSSCSVDFDPVP